MLAELVLSYYLISNMSAHLNVAKQPYINQEVRLSIDHDFSRRWNMKLQPYVMASDRVAQIAGAEFELNYRINDEFMLGFTHHSSHSLDESGRSLSVDGIRVRIQLK